jgi:hypothetical protein
MFRMKRSVIRDSSSSRARTSLVRSLRDRPGFTPARLLAKPKKAPRPAVLRGDVRISREAGWRERFGNRKYHLLHSTTRRQALSRSPAQSTTAACAAGRNRCRR